MCCPGGRIDVALCALYSRYQVSDKTQASCEPGAAAPSSFDGVSARRCLAQIERSYDGCQLARLDASERREMLEVCGHVAPLPAARPREVCGGTGEVERQCAAPSGMVSDCTMYSEGHPSRCSDVHPLAERGGSCSTSAGCVTGLTCVTQLELCELPAQDGEACTAASDCASGSCAYDLEQRSGTCNAQPPLIGPETSARELRLSRAGLYVSPADALWVNDRDLVWRTSKGWLLRAAKAGHGSVEEVLHEPLPYLSGVLDGEYLYVRTGMRSVSRIGVRSGSRDDYVVDFDVGAVEHDGQGMIVAADGCGTVLRLGEDGTELLRANAVRHEPSGANAGRALLVLRDSGVVCASGTEMYMLANGSRSAELLAQLPAAGRDTFSFSALERGHGRVWVRAANVAGEPQLFSLADDSHELQRELAAEPHVRGGFISIPQPT